MNIQLWESVDRYLVDQIVPESKQLDWIIENNRAAGLPAIDVSPTQGKLLQLLVQLTQSRRILEIGTLGGYSTAWMVAGLPEKGQVVTLEREVEHAAIAAANFSKLEKGSQVEIRQGLALESLKILSSEIQAGESAPFDFVFVDADKESCRDYLEACLSIARSGSTIIVDNIIRDGEVKSSSSDDERVHGVRKMLEWIAQEPRIVSTGIQTVGSKGYDGWLLATIR